LLQVTNLEVVYDDVALVLRGISVTVKPGQIVALLGANGAGKTTLLRAITGLLDVHDGEITKGAVLNLTKVFARECGPDGIRVNAILPGLIRTKFAGALLSDAAQVEHYLGQTPLRRVGEPRDIAGAAVFLASDASAYVTGEFLVVDGGFLS